MQLAGLLTPPAFPPSLLIWNATFAPPAKSGRGKGHRFQRDAIATGHVYICVALRRLRISDFQPDAQSRDAAPCRPVFRLATPVHPDAAHPVHRVSLVSENSNGGTHTHDSGSIPSGVAPKSGRVKDRKTFGTDEIGGRADLLRSCAPRLR